MQEVLQYTMRMVRFHDGESYPLLLYQENGIPLWYPTLFITTQVRNSNRSSSTMSSAFEAIKLLLFWADSLGISIESRFAKAQWFSGAELDSLKAFTQRRKNQLSTYSPTLNALPLSKNAEKARMLPSQSRKVVQSGTQYIRMSYIADYMEWLARRIIEDNAKTVSVQQRKDIQDMVMAFRHRRPVTKGRNQENSRIGLSETQREELLRIVSVDGSQNPFSVRDIQIRNQVIVHLLYFLGIRVGELLNLRVRDFDFQANTVLIARRPDDPDDPRLYQPKVKTNDRRLPVTDELMACVLLYITDVRRTFPGAKKHDFLFVTHKQGPTCGNPISLNAINKMFVVLRDASLSLPDNFSPHILRHTSNDRFSEIADQSDMSPAQEEKARSYIYGWKEASGTASTYTKRHTRRMAYEAALKLQNQLEQGELGDD